MSEKLLQTQNEKTRYSQVVVEGKNATSTNTGTQSGNSETEATGSQTSTGKNRQEGNNTREQTAETIRDMISKSTRSGGSSEKANTAFQITFTIPILGRVPTTSTNHC